MKTKEIITALFGFTIMELMVVIVLIGVLAAVALPNFGRMMEKSKSAEGVEILQSVLTAQKLYKFENDAYVNDQTPTALDLLDLDLVPQHFDIPDLYDDTTWLGTPVAVNRIEGATVYYRLSISETNDITCDNEHSSMPDICNQLGLD